MEKKNRKTLILSVIICLLPMILGSILYNKPLIMAIVQAICLIAINTKLNKLKNEEKPKILKIMEWFIPVVSVLFYVIMVEVPLGSTVYVGKSICLILGILLMIIGNYIPKMSYEMSKTTFHPMPKSEKSFRKMSKIMGYSFIVMGIVLLIMIIWV